MEFVCNRAQLVRELQFSRGAVESSTSVPILSHVLLQAGDGRVLITATDLDLAIGCSCAARVRTEGAIAVPGKRFLDYVKLLPGEDVEVVEQANHWIGVKCGAARARMAAMSRESWPALPEAPEFLIEMAGEALSAMIARTEFAISREESRFTLGGALMQTGEATFLCATDGHRLAIAGKPGSAKGGVLVAWKALRELAKLAAADAGPVGFGRSGNHLFFRVGPRLLISREMSGQFPDYDRVLPKSHAHQVAVNREALQGAIERVAQFSDEASHAIRLRVRAGELVLNSSASLIGDSEESVPVDFDGADDLEIGFNATYLLDFLKVVSDETIDFLLTDGKCAGEFRPRGSEGYRYVVMPMRI